MRILGVSFLMIGAAALAFAGPAVGAPEINAGTAGSALALLTGSLLVLRGRRKQ